MNRFNFNKYWKEQFDNGEVTEEEVMKIMDISRKTFKIIKEPHPFINNVENYFGFENVMYLKKNLN
tara:strand:- start:191 stop:388 length:198 start_codon:yes stop_codon:yes gene_type:complete